LVGGDNASDVAVLRLFVSDDAIAGTIVKAKIMSDEYSLKLGESVFAIGNSEGTHGGWVSSGVVADTGSVEEISTIGKMTLLGISVDIYSGNSGGGLFNLYGELVGITNAGKTIEGADGTSSSVGINYAIPIKTSTDLVKDTGFVNVVKQLMATYVKSNGKNYGYVKGRADVYWFEIGLLNGRPAISSVVKGSQADGQLQTGDVIVGYAINDGTYKEVLSYYDISDALYSLVVGDEIAIKFSRNAGYGKTTTFTKKFTAKQYYFCNTGDYTNILA
jgi:serine protease Do